MTLVVALASPGAITFAADSLSVYIEDDGAYETCSERHTKFRHDSGILVGAAGLSVIEGVETSLWALEVMLACTDRSLAVGALMNALVNLRGDELSRGQVDFVIGFYHENTPHVYKLEVKTPFVNLKRMEKGLFGLFAVGATEVFDVVVGQWSPASMDRTSALMVATGLVQAQILMDKGCEKPRVGGSVASLQLLSDGSVAGEGPNVETVFDKRNSLVHVKVLYEQERRELEAFGALMNRAAEPLRTLRSAWKGKKIRAVSDYYEQVENLIPDAHRVEVFRHWCQLPAEVRAQVDPGWDDWCEEGQWAPVAGGSTMVSVGLPFGQLLSRFYLLMDLWDERRVAFGADELASFGRLPRYDMLFAESEIDAFLKDSEWELAPLVKDEA